MLAFGSSGRCKGQGYATHRVGLGGVEVGADDAVFLDLAEESFSVQVGKCGRHCVGVGWFGSDWVGWLGMCVVEAMVLERRGTEIFQGREDCSGCATKGCLPREQLACECDLFKMSP
jgi:hypothetical protein